MILKFNFMMLCWRVITDHKIVLVACRDGFRERGGLGHPGVWGLMQV